jgi:hypothetical protein
VQRVRVLRPQHPRGRHRRPHGVPGGSRAGRGRGGVERGEERARVRRAEPRGAHVAGLDLPHAPPRARRHDGRRGVSVCGGQTSASVSARDPRQDEQAAGGFVSIG